jgi:hypothetical protein
VKTVKLLNRNFTARFSVTIALGAIVSLALAALRVTKVSFHFGDDDDDDDDNDDDDDGGDDGDDDDAEE